MKKIILTILFVLIPLQVFGQSLPPSYKQGFARNITESTESTLWRGLIGAWCPSLGIIGLNTLFDVSGHNNTGTFAGTVLGSNWVIGTEGYGYDLLGSDDYIDILSSVAGGHDFTDLSDNITVLMRINPSAVTGTVTNAWLVFYTIFELRTETSSGTHIPFSFGIDNSVMKLGVTDDHTTTAERASAATTLVVGTEYNMAFVLEGDDWTFYLDGVNDNSGTWSAPTGDRSVGGTTCNMQIGLRSRDQGQKDANEFDGLIHSLFIVERSFKSSEILKFHKDSLALFGTRRVIAKAPAPTGIPIFRRRIEGYCGKCHGDNMIVFKFDKPCERQPELAFNER